MTPRRSSDRHTVPAGVDALPVKALGLLSKAPEQKARTQLVGGRRHLHEAGPKEQRRRSGHPDHPAGPDDA